VIQSNLKLYVWDSGFYGGLAFAIAESEQQAKKLVMIGGADFPLMKHAWGKVRVMPLDEKVAFSVCGES